VSHYSSHLECPIIEVSTVPNDEPNDEREHEEIQICGGNTRPRDQLDLMLCRICEKDAGGKKWKHKGLTFGIKKHGDRYQQLASSNKTVEYSETLKDLLGKITPSVDDHEREPDS